MSETQVAWLTQEAHDRLKQELDELIANRPIIAAKIN
ncbi:MAG: transcription elongation factor GreA, partial [Actinomycetota bacterium]|nr:transcription elongation factor GreA [Actinomycetota bacterium]